MPDARELGREQGLASAARVSLAEGGAPPNPVEEQLDLPGLLGLPPAANTVNNKEKQVVPLRKPGTRAGIRNRRTEEWLDYFSNRGYRLPIESLMAVANLGVDELAKRLCCSALEAMNVIIRVNAEVAPYLHPRLASIEFRARGEPGGRSSTLEIEGSLVDVTPENSLPDAPPANPSDGDFG